MTVRFTIAALLLLFSAKPVMAACPEGSLRPIDFFVLSPGQVAFAAAPSLQYPARAYIVRVSGPGPWEPEAKIEIVQLLRGDDCIQWGQEKQWQSPVTPDEYAEVVRAALAMATPLGEGFTLDSAWSDHAIARDGAGAGLQPRTGPSPPPPPPTDGTGVTLRLRGTNWEISRGESQATTDGAAMSGIFYPLVAKYVPASEVPTEGWTTRENQ